MLSFMCLSRFLKLTYFKWHPLCFCPAGVPNTDVFLEDQIPEEMFGLQRLQV